MKKRLYFRRHLGLADGGWLIVKLRDGGWRTFRVWISTMGKRARCPGNHSVSAGWHARTCCNFLENLIFGAMIFAELLE